MSWFDLMETKIRNSYAHNSALYRFMEKDALPSQILEFLLWDAHQPSFNTYLRCWLSKAPDIIQTELNAHIAEEEQEDHAELFRKMLKFLSENFPVPPPIFDEDRLNDLNYTFSQRCAEEHSFGFFLGSFWATEIMSAKRCGNLFRGLSRHGIPQAPLNYLTIHMESDIRHETQVRKQLLEPALHADPASQAEIEAGILDRLGRSERFLRWYERKLS